MDKTTTTKKTARDQSRQNYVDMLQRSVDRLKEDVAEKEKVLVKMEQNKQHCIEIAGDNRLSVWEIENYGGNHEFMEVIHNLKELIYKRQQEIRDLTEA